MAKFKVGDKVTWQHHNGSLSNEVIESLVEGGYHFKGYGFGGEKEVYPGHVPANLEDRVIPGLHWNGMRWVTNSALPVSRNSVVANAVAAQGVAKNSEIIDQGKFPSGVSVDIKEHNGKKFCDFTVYTDGIMSGYGVAIAQETLKLLKGKVSSLEKAIAFVKSKYPEYIG